MSDECDELKEELRLHHESYDRDIKFAGDALKIIEDECDALRVCRDHWKISYENAMEKYRDIKRENITIIDERDILAKKLKLALAHDTQPYPTADAYEKACAALENTKKKLGIAIKVLEDLQNWEDISDNPIAYIAEITTHALAEIALIEVNNQVNPDNKGERC